MVGEALNSSTTQCPFGHFSVRVGNPAKPTQSLPPPGTRSPLWTILHTLVRRKRIIAAPGHYSQLELFSLDVNRSHSQHFVSAIAKILAGDYLDLVFHFWFLFCFFLFKVVLYLKKKTKSIFSKSTCAVLVTISLWDSAPLSIISVRFSSLATRPSKLLILSDISLYLSAREERGHWRISCRVSSSSWIDPSRLRLVRGQHGSEAEPGRICWETFEPAACCLKSLSPSDTFVPRIITKYRMYSLKDTTFPTWGI